MDNKSNQVYQTKNDPKRRVLFIITQSEFGGAQRFLSQLLNNLDLNKFECAVAAGSAGSQELKTLLPTSVKYIAAKHLQRNPSILSDILSLFEFKKILLEFRPDVLFLNSSKAGFNGSLAAKLLPADLPRPKVIYRIGGWTFNDPRPWHINFFYRLLEKMSSSWKDYIIVNNKHDYDQAIKYGIKPRKSLLLIHNGIDPYKLAFLEKDEAKIRLFEKLPSSQKHANFLHDGILIGAIANFYPTKGLQYLIESFFLLNAKHSTLNANLVLIGDGPERNNLELLTTHHSLQTRVFLAGRIPDAYKYLPAFDIFVLPSVKEGFPWALLEAMSAKLPVIATAVGANPEIIENGSPSTTLPSGKVVLDKNGILVPPADPQALADAIVKLATDESLRRELGIQAHQTVLHKFSLNKMVSQIESLL